MLAYIDYLFQHQPLEERGWAPGRPRSAKSLLGDLLSNYSLPEGRTALKQISQRTASAVLDLWVGYTNALRDDMPPSNDLES